MGDPLANAARGQVSPFVTSADTVNRVLEAARMVRRNERGTFGASPELDSAPSALEVYVRNDTGSSLQVFSVVKLGEPLISAVDAPLNLQSQPLFPGTAPTTATDPFGVLLEPIAEDEVGRAVVLGIAVCDLVVNSSSHGYAAPGSAGGTAALESAAAGPAKIVHKYGTSGTVRALVLLQGDGGTGGSAGSGGCGWVAALTAADCLIVTVPSSSGRCADDSE